MFVKVKVVFLDFDGVLNHVKWRGPGPFNPVCVAWLSKVLLATKAVIVVTSSWRNNRRYATDVERLAHLRGLLDGAGVEGEVLDFTAIGPDRTEGIQMWLKDHGDVETYVVLDDEYVGVPVEKFVRTSSLMGMTGDNAQAAINILQA